MVPAVTGFFCACIGELITGKGALGQLQLETRLPQSVINWGVFAIVVRLLVPVVPRAVASACFWGRAALLMLSIRAVLSC